MPIGDANLNLHQRLRNVAINTYDCQGGCHFVHTIL